MVDLPAHWKREATAEEMYSRSDGLLILSRGVAPYHVRNFYPNWILSHPEFGAIVNGANSTPYDHSSLEAVIAYAEKRFPFQRQWVFDLSSFLVGVLSGPIVLIIYLLWHR